MISLVSKRLIRQRGVLTAANNIYPDSIHFKILDSSSYTVSVSCDYQRCQHYQNKPSQHCSKQHRHFLSLPNLPSLPSLPFDPFNSSPKKNNHERQTYSECKRLNYSLEHVQSVVTDVNQYSSFVPWCVKSNVIKIYDNNNFDAKLAVGFKMFVEEYNSRVQVVPGKSVTATSFDTGLFQHLETRWSFHKVNNDSVDVTFEIDFEFKSKIYSTVSAQFLDEVVGEMVNAFEKQCSTVKTIGTDMNDNTNNPDDDHYTDTNIDTPFSIKELNAVAKHFNDIVSSQGSDVMELSQFKKLYYDLFVHSSSETIEEEKRYEEENDTSNHENVAIVIKMGELMTRTITEKDLNHLAERHFNVMDIDSSGTLDKHEFIAGMEILLHGSVKQQWEHTFQLFDFNNDGYVTKNNLMLMFHKTSNIQNKILLELLKYTRDELFIDGQHNIATQFQIDINQLEKEQSDKDNVDDIDETTHEYPILIQELVNDIFDELQVQDNRISFHEFCQSKILISEVNRLSAHKITFFMNAK